MCAIVILWTGINWPMITSTVHNMCCKLASHIMQRGAGVYPVMVVQDQGARVAVGITQKAKDGRTARYHRQGTTKSSRRIYYVDLKKARTLAMALARTNLATCTRCACFALSSLILEAHHGLVAKEQRGQSRGGHRFALLIVSGSSLWWIRSHGAPCTCYVEPGGAFELASG